ncbi:unnamed protein product [Toxocara canis]|uniref:Uncharacterized protein n=1 Tax=Toxocara canis TaxID=6265 RepID=A0A183TV10_TOXCA|nr:unnamed protein product [Toxocara canis]
MKFPGLIGKFFQCLPNRRSKECHSDISETIQLDVALIKEFVNQSNERFFDTNRKTEEDQPTRMIAFGLLKSRPESSIRKERLKHLERRTLPLVSRIHICKIVEVVDERGRQENRKGECETGELCSLDGRRVKIDAQSVRSFYSSYKGFDSSLEGIAMEVISFQVTVLSSALRNAKLSSALRNAKLSSALRNAKLYDVEEAALLYFLLWDYCGFV